MSDEDQASRERRLRWLVFGGVALGLVVMAVIFIIVGSFA
jgi:hypothetical protein